VPGKQFLIAEACSGVKSLFTIMFIAALVISMKRRSMLHGLALVVVGYGDSGFDEFGASPVCHPCLGSVSV
jgi:hypothetical protein